MAGFSHGGMVARRDPQPELPGNDGTWFLRLAGALDEEPGQRGALDALAAETAEQPAASPFPTETTTVGAVLTVEGLEAPPTGAAPTGVVTAPPAPAAPELPSDWTPAPIEAPLQTTRRFRIGTVIALLAVVAAIAAAVVALPRAASATATQTALRYQAALVDLRNELPDTQQALAVLTDPGADAVALADTVPAIAALEAASHDVAALASEPLPGTLPLVPRAEIDALQAPHDEMAIEAMEASSIASSLGHLFTYRTALDEVLAPGPLPTQADATTRDSLAVELAADLAADAEEVASLPADPDLDPVATLAAGLIDRYAAWQDRYLIAVEAGDETATAELLGELDAMRAELDAALHDAMLEMRAGVDARIIDLAGTIEATLGSL